MAEKRSLKKPTTDQLFQAVLSLKTLDDCYTFFEDLCTLKELKDMAQRLEGARLLLEGKTYDQIVKSVEISTATISRINRCIQGGTGGYQEMLERIGALELPGEEAPAAEPLPEQEETGDREPAPQSTEKKNGGWKWNADCD